MAVDYGDARTGIAVSDLSGTITGDAWVLSLKDRTDIVGEIGAEATTRGVSVIVVGYPLNMDGTAGPRAQISEQFAGNLREILAAAGQNGIEVVLWDERMTTMSAHRILTDVGKFGKKRKKTVDAVAASLILENYLQSLS